MARNLRKGSKVLINTGHREVEGIGGFFGVVYSREKFC